MGAEYSLAEGYSIQKILMPDLRLSDNVLYKHAFVEVVCSAVAATSQRIYPW
jgi:hypothetical protein